MMNGRTNYPVSNTVRINICGTVFQCSPETLGVFKESKLANLNAFGSYDSGQNEYFFDRNPFMFNCILDACRKGAIHLPKDMCGTSFSEELKFWGLSPSHVAPCCWEALYGNEDDNSRMQEMTEYLRSSTNLFLQKQDLPSWRRNLWLFLDEPSSSLASMIWGCFITILTITACLMMALGTLPKLTVNFSESEKPVVYALADIMGLSNQTATMVVSMKPHPYLHYTEAACHFVLTLDFMCAFLICPLKKIFASSYKRLLVLLGYLCFWISFIMEENFDKLSTESRIRAYLAMKVLSVLQVIRLFYLTKRIPAFNVMYLTFISCTQELKVMLFLLGILMFIFGFVMFIAELLQGATFENAFQAMYWALITLTTVGYGDFTPSGPIGHVVAGACAICGILVLALPVCVIASSFSKFYNYQAYAEKHIRRYGKVSSDETSKRTC